MMNLTKIQKGHPLIIAVIIEAAKKVVEAGAIQKSWKHVGLYPFNPELIRKRLIPFQIVEPVTPKRDLTHLACHIGGMYLKQHSPQIELEANKYEVTKNLAHTSEEVIKYRLEKNRSKPRKSRNSENPSETMPQVYSNQFECFLRNFKSISL